MPMTVPREGGKVASNAAVPGVRLLRIDSLGVEHRGVKEQFSVSWMIAGRTHTWRRGRNRSYAAGSIIVSQPGEVHNDRRIESPVSYRIAAFDPQRMEQARAAMGVPTNGELEIGEVEPRAPEAGPIRNMLRSLFAPQLAVAAQEEAVDDGLAALIGLARCRRKPADWRETPITVQRAQEFMRERQDDALRIHDVADVVGVDQFRLIRAFRQHVGMSPYEWLTHLRITRAKVLLAEGHTATEVAQQLGYCDQSQLHRHFRRIVGTTPGAFARDTARRQAGFTADF